MAAVDIRVKAAEETAEVVRAPAGEAIAVVADVTCADQTEAAVLRTVETYGGLEWASPGQRGRVLDQSSPDGVGRSRFVP